MSSPRNPSPKSFKLTASEEKLEKAVESGDYKQVCAEEKSATRLIDAPAAHNILMIAARQCFNAYLTNDDSFLNRFSLFTKVYKFAANNKQANQKILEEFNKQDQREINFFNDKLRPLMGPASPKASFSKKFRFTW